MRGHLEDDLQMACVRWFCYQYQNLAMLLHHSPNGGFRNGREAARFKAMGTRAGFPDLVLLIPRKGYHALFIELKVGNNDQTEFQKEFQLRVESMGYKYVVCRSFDDFSNEVTEYLENRKAVQ